MTITALPTPPSPSDSPAAFNTKAFDLLGALPTFVTEANGLGAEIAAAASAAATAAANAALASKLDAANPSYTGNLTGGTGVVNLGSGQFYKDASGNVGLGVTPIVPFHLSKGAAGDEVARLVNAGGFGLRIIPQVGGSGAKTQIKVGGGESLSFATNNAEAMTIDNSGNLILANGGTLSGTPTTGVQLIMSHSASNAAGISIGHASGTGSGAIFGNFCLNGSAIGSITQSGTTAVVYNTTSDHRLKTNVRPSDARRFTDIQFRDFEWIDGRHDCGVIAHELQAIYPDLVMGEKDATEIRTVEVTPAQYKTITIPAVLDDEGNEVEPERTEQKLIAEAVTEEQEFPVYQQVNYMGLIARMGTVVQRHERTIEALQTQLDTQNHAIALLTARLEALEAA